MEKFAKWSTDNGISSIAEIKQTEHAGYGLFSLMDIPIDHEDSSTRVAHIPKKMLLTPQTALQVHEDFHQLLYQLISQNYGTDESLDLLVQSPENERLVLCLFLVFCKFFHKSLFWEGYIDILPTLEFFKENHVLFETECVTGTSLETSVHAKLSKLSRELQQINQQGSWMSEITLDMYLWADCTFWSRAVGIGDDDSIHSANMALIPFFDFANHSANKSNIRWQLCADGEGLDLVTLSTNPIKEGEELLLSYGAKSNQELLFIHGFCNESNPEHSCIVVSLLNFLNPAQDPLGIQKIQWFRQFGIKPSLKLNFVEVGKKESLLECGWSHESICAMYMVVLEEDNEIKFTVSEEEEDRVIFFQRSEEIDSLNGLEKSIKAMAIFPVIELRVIMLLLDALMFQLSENKKAPSHATKKESSSLQKQANIYKSEEKELLENAIHDLSQLRDKMLKMDIVLQYLENS